MGEWDVRYVGSRVRATDTKTFAFERPDGLTYAPGQFFFVLLPGTAEAPEHVLEHHFSFSSSPTEPVVEFTTRLTGHEFKNRLDALPEGEVVHIAGPDGAFVLRPGMTRVAYITGGIGVTPVRSVVRWALDTRADLDIVVLYANHDLASAAFHEEFGAIESDRIRVVDVLSQPEPGWTGRVGRIDADVVREEIPDWAERSFFVSGPPTMVDSLIRVLSNDVGVPVHQEYSEHFPGYT